MPVISVILPTCDRPDLIGRALASVLAQTGPDFEVVVVDNNRLAAPVAAGGAPAALLADPRVRVIHDTVSRSAAQARNTGLGQARGEWITYLDDDDAYRPDKLRLQWELAQLTGSPLVLCGYRVILRGRRRVRQVGTDCFRGDELLLDATWGTPMLFHRADPALRFNPELVAGEDEFMAHQVMRHFDLRAVPNCPQPLLDVYPLRGRPRIHVDFEKIWRSYRATARLTAGRFSPEARRFYLLKGLLVRAQGGDDSWRRFLRLAAAVCRARGGRDWRLAANAIANRTKVLRPFIVT
jgi:glycosyltransferase involved in cell wall biosynthesis